MSNNSIVDKIEFAIKYKVPCEVYYKNSYRPWKINIYAFDGNQIQWRNAETENPETGNAEADLKLMNLSNIRNCNFTGNDDIEFRKYIKCKNNGIDDYKSAKENLENLFHYYGAILEAQINELVSKKTLTKDEETELVSLKNKSKLLETILKKLFESEGDLLFPFVMGSEFNNSIIDAEDRPILLLGNSNASQKSAIEKSLSEKVSFIEGPPGTGKTTTILSIVANLLYRNQKAVVVSKNNSAIDKFILVTDKKYFSERLQLIKNLILYIDKYGKEIPDKTVCLFDYLYKQMPTYVEVKNCSNPFELKVFETLEKFCDEHKGFSVFAKLPLAELVTDGYYLNTHDEIRHFVLNERTHVDFTIVNALENPVLAIELDGQEHDSEIQIQRDIKKNKALEHMNIPLKRINSKSAFSEQDLISMVESAVCNASATKKYL